MGGFLLLVAAMLAIDLGVINKKDHVVSVKEALVWTCVWIATAMLFYLFIRFRAEWIHGITSFEQLEHLNKLHNHGLVLDPAAGLEAGIEAYRKAMSLEYLTGYLIEKALSVDNIFVMIMIFLSFKVDPKYYHKVLFWGILGAVVMRFLFIFLSAALISRFAWVLWIFGGVLIFTGVKMAVESIKNGLGKEEEEEHKDMSKNKVVRWLSRRLRMTRSYHEGKFFTRIRIRPRDSATYRNLLFVTPLFLVLLVVEGSDVIFAVDSIPAIFSVTLDPYIVFFSNIFAILGLRSLFFVLSGILGKFVYLKPGLAVLLTFVGVKMLLPVVGKELLPLIGFKGFGGHISTPVSLLIIVGILTVSIVASLLFPPKEV
jgi:tellurite resistance protein TerC